MDRAFYLQSTPYLVSVLETLGLDLEEPKQLKLLSGLLTWVYRNIEA